MQKLRGFIRPLGFFCLSTHLKHSRILPKIKSEIKHKEEMRMQTTFEKLGGTYRQAGDYLLPDIEVPKSPQIGIWGQRRLQYLRTHKRVLYTTMLMGDTLKAHLEEVDKSAEDMFAQLTLRICHHIAKPPV